MEEFLNQLCGECEGIASVWLIGSRANDTAEEGSDWDFIVFADQRALKSIKQKEGLHLPTVDLLVVYDGDQFANAWGEKEKTGSLSSWKWKQVSDDIAEYTENKWVENEDGENVVSQRRKAIRMWPK